MACRGGLSGGPSEETPDRSQLARGAGLFVRGSDRLRLGRATLPQVDGEGSHRTDGEELRLPVLQAAIPKVGVHQVLTVRNRSALVFVLAVVEGPPAVQRLSEPREEEDGGHDEHERVRIDPKTCAGRLRPRGGVGLRMAADSLLLADSSPA